MEVMMLHDPESNNSAFMKGTRFVRITLDTE